MYRVLYIPFLCYSLPDSLNGLNWLSYLNMINQCSLLEVCRLNTLTESSHSSVCLKQPCTRADNLSIIYAYHLIMHDPADGKRPTA